MSGEEQSFQEFTHLPPEIRREIWLLNLAPPDDGPAVQVCNWRWLYSYADPDAATSGPTRVAERPLKVEGTPLCAEFFVCRESRAVATKFYEDAGQELRYRPETGGHILTRPWDPARDVLYVGRENWKKFRAKKKPRYRAAGKELRHLAVPAFSGYYGISAIAGQLGWMPNLDTISVVWGPVPVRRRQSPVRSSEVFDEDVQDMFDLAVQPRWELHKLPPDTETVQMAIPNDGVHDRLDDGGGPSEECELELMMEEIGMEWADQDMPLARRVSRGDALPLQVAVTMAPRRQDCWAVNRQSRVIERSEEGEDGEKI